MPIAVATELNGDHIVPDIMKRSLNYDDAVDDFLADLPMATSEQNNVTTQPMPPNDDREVQVKRQRKPVPKLDEDCLLSNAGIPRLRKITKTQVKFRGKGHEFSDISRLLNTYQLWLDDLYPRAKFKDALSMVEKVGHSKRMHVTRKTWLDETKPNRRELTPPSDVLDADGGTNPHDSMQDDAPGSGSPIFGTVNDGVNIDDPHGITDRRPSLDPNVHHRATQSRGPFEVDSDPDEDELDALLAENGVGPTRSLHEQRTHPSEDDEPNEDELDVLLAENATSTLQTGTTSTERHNAVKDANDDLGAVVSQSHATDVHPRRPTPHHVEQDAPDDDFAAEEEAMAGMW